jgi:hypothetical protein
VADFSLDALVVVACADPWTTAAQVLDGDPAAIDQAAAGFRAAAAQATEIARSGQEADRTFAAAYRENRAPVFDAAESRTTSRRLLADDGHTTTEAARILGDVAHGLSDAQSDVRAQLELLTQDVNAVITARNARVSDTTLTAAELQTIDRGFEQQAADRVRSHDQQIKKIVDKNEVSAAS